MSEYLIQDTTLTSIGDAIRGKTGESSTLTPAQMASKITSDLAKPTGTKSITANGTGIDVMNYASVDVSVSGGSVTVESLTVTSNGTTTAPEGKAYSPVIVNVPTGHTLKFSDDAHFNIEGTIKLVLFEASTNAFREVTYTSSELPEKGDIISTSCLFFELRADTTGFDEPYCTISLNNDVPGRDIAEQTSPGIESWWGTYMSVDLDDMVSYIILTDDCEITSIYNYDDYEPEPEPEEFTINMSSSSNILPDNTYNDVAAVKYTDINEDVITYSSQEIYDEESPSDTALVDSGLSIHKAMYDAGYITISGATFDHEDANRRYYTVEAYETVDITVWAPYEEEEPEEEEE